VVTLKVDLLHPTDKHPAMKKTPARSHDEDEDFSNPPDWKNPTNADSYDPAQKVVATSARHVENRPCLSLVAA
jgi:hypothetical protein